MYYHDSMSISEAREYFKARLSDIRLSKEMDSKDMMSLNCMLDELYSDIFVDYSYWKTQIEVIESKIEQVEKGECIVGSNTESRKARAIKIAQNFPLEFINSIKLDKNFDYENYKGEKIDLYQLKDEALSWYYLYKTIMDAIQFKADRLIILASGLKTEASVVKNTY